MCKAKSASTESDRTTQGAVIETLYFRVANFGLAESPLRY